MRSTTPQRHRPEIIERNKGKKTSAQNGGRAAEFNDVIGYYCRVMSCLLFEVKLTRPIVIRYSILNFCRHSPPRMSSSGHAQTSNSSAIRALQMELRSLQSQPVEVGIFGPPGTLYQGGYFKAHLKFPTNYPYSPPTMRFIHSVWHPNVYENGDTCISILHPPVDDPHMISLLNEPNTSSPANVDASVMYRKYKDYGDQEYATVIRKQVDKSKEEARKDNVVVPETIDEYVVKAKPKLGNESNDVIDLDEDYYDYEDDDTDEDGNYGGDDEEDSGQGDDES
uniref:UBC core domain-containing protein n=2 Tax=Globodera rostochiensis TaxID=31243 RepID=A0A914GYA2_GLORO